MTKRSTVEDPIDDLRPHYDFDYAKMKPNRFASEVLIHKQAFVALDEDVSEVFDSSKKVNDALRSVIRAKRGRSKSPK